MKMFRFTEQPRLLAVLALAFALVPVCLAVVTYRDARQKDERVYETTAQVLAEQIQNLFERHTYLPIDLRNRGRTMDDAALSAGGMMPAFPWKERVPHLLALGYAERMGERIIVRWVSEMRAPVARVGDDLAENPAIPAALGMTVPSGPSATKGCLLPNHRMLVLLELPGNAPASSPRGYVLGWIDLDAMCRDAALPLLNEQVLTATVLADGDPVPAGALLKSLSDGAARWQMAVARGAKFSLEYSPSTPWPTFLATGLSALPLLILASLAGRSAKLNAALSAEREVVRQQRFFTQSVSHEFRTPLGIIMSGADLLDGYAEHLTPERRREVLAEIRGNTRQMSDMVEQVLMLGRIESSRLPFQPKPQNVAALCADIVRKVNTASGTGHPIAVTAPDAEAPLDASLLGSVLDNLLSNAIKYSPDGKRVKLDAVTSGAQITFIVRDEGVGIPADEIARACDPFHRCANVGAVPGTGLGLAITQRCVALQGGTMKIESAEGRGTSVTVTLPFTQPA